MDLVSSLDLAFPNGPSDLTDEYIESHPELLHATHLFPLFELVPAYMSWCLRSERRNELLVMDYTIQALSELGRHRHSEPEHLNFRAKCTALQREAVIQFLAWSLSGAPSVHKLQAERSLKQWLRD